MGNDIDDIQNKLDAIQNRNEELVKQTPAEYNASKVKGYYEDLLQAQRIKDEAPNQLKSAEENYYKARFGDKYMDVLIEKYTAESKEVLQTMMDAHQRQLTEVNYKIKTYAASMTYFNNINEVKKTWMDKVKKWIQQIQKSRASLNNRNTFYAEQEQANLSNWILYENCFLISFIIVTILLGYSQLTTVKMIGLVALVCIVFFTNTVLSWLHYLPKSVTYYTQWGYDPMESKVPWFLLIALVLFGTLCIVYVDVIRSFLTNMKENAIRFRRGEPLVWSRPGQPQWRRDASGRWVRVGTPGTYRPTPRELEARRALLRPYDRDQELIRALAAQRDQELRRALEAQRDQELRRALEAQRALDLRQALARARR